MGYGSRALSLLIDYYEFKMPIVDDITEHKIDADCDNSGEYDLYTEDIEPRSTLPPLLSKLTERIPEKLNYMGVSYGLTGPLIKFWKLNGFIPVYLRQTPNDITGEHSCIMIRRLESEEASWLHQYWLDFKRRFISLLSYQFKKFETSLAVSVLYNVNDKESPQIIDKVELDCYLTSYDLKRLELYCNNLADYHLIMDLLPSLSRIYFLNKLGTTKCSSLQSLILLALGLQHKTVDELASELGLTSSHILGLFNKTIRKIHQVLMSITETEIEKSLGTTDPNDMSLENTMPLKSLAKELESADKAIKKKQGQELSKLREEFEIKGVDAEWEDALKTGSTTSIVSVKSNVSQKKKKNPLKDLKDFEQPSKKLKKYKERKYY